MRVYDLPMEKPGKANDLTNIIVSTLWSQDLPGQASLAAVPELCSSLYSCFILTMALPSRHVPEGKTKGQGPETDCQHTHGLKRTKLGFIAMMPGSRAQEPFHLARWTEAFPLPPEHVMVSFVKLT